MKNSQSYKSYLNSPYRSIKHSTYFEIYDELFSRFCGKEITFVEIGVLGGGSLFMWRDFFGPKARIIGVDLNPNAKKWEEHGFEIFIGSQSDDVFWEEFKKQIGPIDVILDDGGHTYDQQIITTESLISNINDGGVLVVEDTHTSYMSGFGPKKYSFVEYTKKMVDAINQRFGGFAENKVDDRIWSIEIYESIVAFKVNRKASSLPSEITDNGGTDDHAMDFRHSDNNAVKQINAAARRFNLLKYIPGLKYLARTLRTFVVNRQFRAKKYFE